MPHRIPHRAADCAMAWTVPHVAPMLRVCEFPKAGFAVYTLAQAHFSVGRWQGAAAPLLEALQLQLPTRMARLKRLEERIDSVLLNTFEGGRLKDSFLVFVNQDRADSFVKVRVGLGTHATLRKPVFHVQRVRDGARICSMALAGLDRDLGGTARRISQQRRVGWKWKDKTEGK